MTKREVRMLAEAIGKEMSNASMWGQWAYRGVKDGDDPIWVKRYAESESRALDRQFALTEFAESLGYSVEREIVTPVEHDWVEWTVTLVTKAEEETA